MKVWIVVLIGLALAGVGALSVWRYLDRQADTRAWDELAASIETEPGTYDPAMVAELPEPAQRYFNYMIEPGAPLHSVVEIEMTGQIGLGTKAAPNYREMSARQILAPPYGLVWQLEAGSFSGSDSALPGASWTRFWLFDLLPVVRVSGHDHRRSAFGRVVAEAAFWAPSSLLPGEFVRWEAIDSDSARAIVRFESFEQAVEITIDEFGAPTQVTIPRWSNANADEAYRLQPFGVELSEFRRFGGYRLPTRVVGGNHFGTPDYFPFFKARITEIRFPDAAHSPSR
ncbi:MAG: hypothetical protein QNJ05_15220 [Woeseiaceae bacterium]|nr:hypothetical protein [Woeseiaceae bacterium]